jgi:hypothetical protein
MLEEPDGARLFMQLARPKLTHDEVNLKAPLGRERRLWYRAMVYSLRCGQICGVAKVCESGHPQMACGRRTRRVLGLSAHRPLPVDGWTGLKQQIRGVQSITMNARHLLSLYGCVISTPTVKPSAISVLNLTSRHM